MQLQPLVTLTIKINMCPSTDKKWDSEALYGSHFYFKYFDSAEPNFKIQNAGNTKYTAIRSSNVLINRRQDARVIGGKELH